MRNLLIISILLILLKSALAYDNKIKIVFRFDDFILENNSFQDSLLILFEKNRIPLSIGIIPYDQANPPKPIMKLNATELKTLQEIIKSGEIEAAMHGFNHYKNTTSEFGNLDYTTQFNMLKKGKTFLDSALNTSVVTFIPPWNEYDQNTLTALKKNNFWIISADLYRTAVVDSFAYLPATYDKIRDLRKIISQNQKCNVILVIMFHKYDFIGHSNPDSKFPSTLGELNELLIWISKAGIQTYTFSGLVESGEVIDMTRYSINSKLFDGIVSKKFKYVYVPASFRWVKVVDFAFWIALFLFIYALIIFLNSILKSKIKAGYIVSLLILISLSLIILISTGRYSPKFLILMVGLISTFFGLTHILLLKRFNKNRI